MSTINISDLDKAEVLAALYNAAQAQGMGFLQYDPEPMAVDEARAILTQQQDFDYLKGRVMKISLADDELRTDLYNHDNGPDAAEYVIQTLRNTGMSDAEEIEHLHLENTRKAAQHVRENLDEETAFEQQGQWGIINIGLNDVADDLRPHIDEILDDE